MGGVVGVCRRGRVWMRGCGLQIETAQWGGPRWESPGNKENYFKYAFSARAILEPHFFVKNMRALFLKNYARIFSKKKRKDVNFGGRGKKGCIKLFLDPLF